MSLTRNQWLDMWATVKVMESNANTMRELLPYLPPYRRNQLRGIIVATISQTAYMKQQIQSIIGQME